MKNTLLLFLSLLGCSSTDESTEQQSSTQSTQKNIPQQVSGNTNTPAPFGNIPHPPDGKPLPPSDGRPVGATGTGVFTKEAPSKSKDAQSTALCPNCDIFIVTLCSLRKDHVSAYGEISNLTPSIDKIAKEGAVFTKTYAASSFTLAGLTALLTGRFASTTGVTGWDKGLTQDIPTLPEILGFYGYKTAGFTTNSASGFRPDYGLDRGFQHMHIYDSPPGTPDGRHFQGSKILGAPAIPLKNWLLKQPNDKPIFAMLHSRSAHFPFVIDTSAKAYDQTGLTEMLFESGQPIEGADELSLPGMAGGGQHSGVVPIAGQDPLQTLVNSVGEPAVKMWKNHYADAVNRMDMDIAVVLDALKSSKRWDNAVVLIVADHGESLNDHGELLHGDGYFDGVTNVPMVLRVPNLPPQKIDQLTSHVDILPTLLEIVGAMPPTGIDGTSMIPLLKGGQDDIRAVAFSEGGVAAHSIDNLPGAVFAPPWKLLRQMRGCGDNSMNAGLRYEDNRVPICLYHEDDVEQKNNVALENKEVVQELLTLWKEFRKTRSKNTGEQLQLTPDFVEELRRNGYNFQSGAPK